jgi:hypothetical protein
MAKKKEKLKGSEDKAEKSKKPKVKKKKSKQTKKQKKDRTKATQSKTSPVDPQQRNEMIAEAAYFIAEKHGFDPTRAAQDWQEAVGQIDDMLNSTSV